MSIALRTSHHVFVLDCPDAVALAEFYARLLGWRVEISSEEADWADVKPPDAVGAGFHIAFQQIDDYVAPTWPEGPVPQQNHLDFYVASLDESEPLALAAGAVKHSVQPGENDGFTVFLDPVGHLFCLCEHEE